MLGHEAQRAAGFWPLQSLAVFTLDAADWPEGAVCCDHLAVCLFGYLPAHRDRANPLALLLEWGCSVILDSLLRRVSMVILCHWVAGVVKCTVLVTLNCCNKTP